MSTTLEILHTGGVIVDRTLPYHRPADPHCPGRTSSAAAATS
ncbi:hypothetical protein [Actinomyces israelii]|nr:hypothetical protein [Actinomyces israelii]